MFGLGQQYSVYFFSFPKSVFISLPKKKSRFMFLHYLHTFTRSYVTGRDMGEHVGLTCLESVTPWHWPWELRPEADWLLVLWSGRSSPSTFVLKHKRGTRMFTTFSVQLHPWLRFFLSFWDCHMTFASSTVTARLFRYIPAFPLIFASFCGVRNV